MRVLYANPVFLDYRIPFYSELNRLLEGDFKVLYASSRYTNGKNDIVVKKIEERLREISIDFEGDKVIMIKKPFNKDFDSYYRIPIIRGLNDKLKELKPEVILTEGFYQWTPNLVWYAWLHKIPVYICYERTSHTERFAPFFKVWQRKLTDKFVTGYFVNGTETKQYLLSLGINKEKIHVGGMNADSKGLTSGVSSMTLEDKLRLREELNLCNSGLTYLYSGKFIPRKGIVYLLNAWKEHVKKFPNDSLLLIGNGELWDEYRKDYGSLQGVRMLGRIVYDSVYKYYGISDVFVIPTLEDNWCLVVPEAMSVGMPIACSKYNGGAVDLIKEGENGTVFDPLSLRSTVDALSFFHNKDLQNMGKRSVELEEPWNAENCAKRIYEVLSKESSI